MFRLLEGEAGETSVDVPQIDGLTVGYGSDEAMFDRWSDDVEDSYWDDQTATVIEDGTEVEDQGIGVGDESGVTGFTTAEITGDFAEDTMFDCGDTWNVLDDDEDGNVVSYPFLQNNTQEPAPGEHSRYAAWAGDEDLYEIADWHHLDGVRANLDANFTLANDLDEETAGHDDVASETANGGDDGRLPVVPIVGGVAVVAVGAVGFWLFRS